MGPLTISQRRSRFLEVLRDVRDRHLPFHIGQWIETREPDEQHSCGTAACAIGYGMLDPILSGEGLGAKISVADPIYGREKILATSAEHPFSVIRPYFEGQEGIMAAAVFFGLDYVLAGHCFFGKRYLVASKDVTVEMVLTRTERVFSVSKKALAEG